MGTEWDEVRTELLKRLWAAGETARTIAERLGGGVTRNAVIGKAHRLGLTGQHGKGTAPAWVSAAGEGPEAATQAEAEEPAPLTRRCPRSAPISSGSEQLCPARWASALRRLCWPRKIDAEGGWRCTRPRAKPHQPYAVPAFCTWNGRSVQLRSALTSTRI